MPRILTPAILAVSFFRVDAAFADDDCHSPMSQWQPQDAVVQHAAKLGIQVSRLKIDDGCYEIKGHDSDRNKVELKLDPASLALRELEVEFRPGSDPSRYLKGAKTPASLQHKASPGHPLSEQDSTPEVEMK
ncbi:MAG: PepSY domain-containing protein [Gammaproteobacteria bacterium]|nr:PepSY domain-containing protein [Gammaproteobacteria bacterium]